MSPESFVTELGLQTVLPVLVLLFESPELVILCGGNATVSVFIDGVEEPFVGASSFRFSIKTLG